MTLIYGVNAFALSGVEKVALYQNKNWAKAYAEIEARSHAGYMTLGRLRRIILALTESEEQADEAVAKALEYRLKHNIPVEEDELDSG